MISKKGMGVKNGLNFYIRINIERSFKMNIKLYIEINKSGNVDSSVV